MTGKGLSLLCSDSSHTVLYSMVTGKGLSLAAALCTLYTVLACASVIDNLVKYVRIESGMFVCMYFGIILLINKACQSRCWAELLICGLKQFYFFDIKH